MQPTVTLTREQLYDLVWQKPMSRLAAEYAISDVGLAKVCARYEIPTPPRGYWAQLEAGRPPPRPKLPTSRGESSIRIPIGPLEGVAPEAVDKLSIAVATEKGPESRIVVGERLHSPCALVAQAKVALQDAKSDALGFIERPPGCMALRVSRSTLPRALRIANALLKALNARGWSVVVEGNVTRVNVDQALLEFSISEGTVSEEKPVAEDLSSSYYSFHHKRHETVRKPSGRLTIEIRESRRLWNAALRRKWHDSDKRTLEEQLNDVIVGMLRLAAAVRTENERQEKSQQEALERQRRVEAALAEQKRLRAEVASERARIELLRDQAYRWRESETIRRYVEEARTRGKLPELSLEGEELARWADWASRQADRIDPFTPSPPSILDDEERIQHMRDRPQGNR